MDYMAIWNEICFHVNKNRNASERDFQTTVEFLLVNLGWSQYRGEIVSQTTIPVGASNNVKPDIVIKDNGQVILVMELKKPSSVMSERNAEQLKSYMRLLRLSFGILFGETLQVYYELPEDSELPIKVNDIPFVDNSDEGAKFIQLLSKHDYSFQNLQKYCIDSLENAKKYKNAQEHIDLLCSDKGVALIIDLLKCNLARDFSEELVSMVVDKINVRISKKEENVSSIPLHKPLSQKPATFHPDVDTDNLKVINKNKAIKLCIASGISFSASSVTFASLNKARKAYWANPYVDLLQKNWWILLNDYKRNELHIFNIPASSISATQIVVRADKPNRIDMQIIYGDKSFKDDRSKIKFEEWFVKTIPY